MMVGELPINDLQKTGASKAQAIKTGLLTLAAAVFGLRILVNIYQMIAAIRTDTIPSVLVQFGANQETLRELKRTSIIYHVATFVPQVLEVAIFFVILVYGWVARVWEKIDEEYFPDAKPTTKAVAFMALWSCLIAIIDHCTGNSALLGFTHLSSWVVGAIALVNGAILGFFFYRIAKHLSPLKSFAVMAGICILNVSLLVSTTLLEIRSATSPLERNAKTESIFKLAAMENFPASRLYRMPGTENAFYLDALVTDMVVIGDLIMDNFPDTVTGVIAHELGHRKNKDGLKSIAWTAVSKMITPAIAVFLVLPNPILYSAFGFSSEPIIAALPIASVVGSVVEEFVRPFNLWHSRSKEYAADEHAVSRGYGNQLATFFASAKGGLVWEQSWLFEKLFLTHPSMLNRVENVVEKMKSPKELS